MKKYFKKIVGENVFLSPVSMDDKETFVEWMNDFGNTDFTCRSDMLVTMESEQKWLEDATSGDKYIFAIVNLENEKLLGVVELMHVRYPERSATIGIFIGKSTERSKGFGSEALRLVVEYGFKYLNLHSINLNVLEANPRAKKCYEKVGFKENGRIRESKFIAGKYYDLICMDILENEFEGGFIKNRNL